ncbi:carbon-nitrogen hydrolase family protein [Aestuariibacter salexigens]|uniref:carbon-nitrogen hydrolase family protein n=1 Tax=Aestuariibacter salexigens TaxID=226010 RepID=UPI000551DA60|nr:carbon-nitrogen hydrolase family protein [Aestuariibacter salexigens]
MVSTPVPEQNLATVTALLENLDTQDDTLVVVPECAFHFGGRDRDLLGIAEEHGSGPIQAALSSLAREKGIWLVAGTMPLKTDDESKFSASCLLFGPDGAELARYDKIHMFDVQVDDNTRSYMESKYTKPGNDVIVVDTPFGRLGLAVCYDLRFAGLFHAMGEIDILALPSAFTKATGKAHWHPLIQARAIENQCYVVAPNQGGEHNNGRQTYGHSCIVSPWGEILVQKREGSGVIQTPCSAAELERIRASMPVRQHDRFRSNFDQ